MTEKSGTPQLQNRTWFLQWRRIHCKLAYTHTKKSLLLKLSINGENSSETVGQCSSTSLQKVREADKHGYHSSLTSFLFGELWGTEAQVRKQQQPSRRIILLRDTRTTQRLKWPSNCPGKLLLRPKSQKERECVLIFCSYLGYCICKSKDRKEKSKQMGLTEKTVARQKMKNKLLSWL